MKATKKLLCMALAMTTIGTSAVHAQRVTYNHDTSKKNQVTVMELGSGSLTPELYYTAGMIDRDNSEVANIALDRWRRAAALTR